MLRRAACGILGRRIGSGGGGRVRLSVVAQLEEAGAHRALATAEGAGQRVHRDAGGVQFEEAALVGVGPARVGARQVAVGFALRAVGVGREGVGGVRAAARGAGTRRGSSSTSKATDMSAEMGQRKTSSSACQRDSRPESTVSRSATTAKLCDDSGSSDDCGSPSRTTNAARAASSAAPRSSIRSIALRGPGSGVPAGPPAARGRTPLSSYTVSPTARTLAVFGGCWYRRGTFISGGTAYTIEENEGTNPVFVPADNPRTADYIQGRFG